LLYLGGMLVMLWNVVMTAWQGKAPLVTIPAVTVHA
jgi:cytochrome c oxidase cbb3-type subunit 1